MKHFKFLSLLAAMLLTGTFTLSSCGGDDDGDADVTPDVVVEPSNTEKNSKILGTWYNLTSDNMRYVLVFKADGTGYYISEGTKETNFSNYSKKDFKFTTASSIGSTNTSQIITGVVGSIEISFVGNSSDNEVGSFIVTEDGKLQLDGFRKIDKTIFTKGSELATADFTGLWNGDYTDDSSMSYLTISNAFLRVESDGSGYINGYAKTQYNEGVDKYYSDFNGDVQKFDSYEVTGDIVTFKVKNDVTGEITPVAYMRYQQNSLGGYTISYAGLMALINKNTTSITDITSSVRGLWLENTEEDENVLLLSSNNRIVYIHKYTTDVYYGSDNFTLRDSITGQYSLLDYNICIDRSYYTSMGKYVEDAEYILADLSYTGNYFGFYSNHAYRRFYKGTDNSSSLKGHWTLASESDYANYYEDAIVDNESASSYRLYKDIEFSDQNLVYLTPYDSYNYDEDTYLTGLFVAGTGKVYIVGKDGVNINKQYSWEKNGDMLYLKYNKYGKDHVIVYKKTNLY